MPRLVRKEANDHSIKLAETYICMYVPQVLDILVDL